MLIIPHVRESDNGEYCCTATNGIGEPAKSCGALQLKMSTSAFGPGCRPPRLPIESHLLHLSTRASDQTASRQRYPAAGIQSRVALRHPGQPQAACHLAER